MDIVIFTGRMPLEEFKRGQAAPSTRRWSRSGKLEEHLVRAVPADRHPDHPRLRLDGAHRRVP